MQILNDTKTNENKKTQHLRWCYGLTLCGIRIDSDNTINEESDGTKFDCVDEEKCETCMKAMQPYAKFAFDFMLGRIKRNEEGKFYREEK